MVEQEGFEYEPEKPDLPSWVEQKWGWRALMPGAYVLGRVGCRPLAGRGQRAFVPWAESCLSAVEPRFHRSTARVRLVAAAWLSKAEPF